MARLPKTPQPPHPKVEPITLADEIEQAHGCFIGSQPIREIQSHILEEHGEGVDGGTVEMIIMAMLDLGYAYTEK